MNQDVSERFAGNWQSFNVNPKNKRVGDCVVRAIAAVLDQDWYTTFFDLCAMGARHADMPSADVVWGDYLKSKGFRRSIPSCEDQFCMTVRDFCKEHPEGVYILCPKSHVIAVMDGIYYDTFDSGAEILLYYWFKEE